ncbi:MAG TPA: DUF4412 domain-containing protein [Verrucomicrobiae bacterium]|nr:DUF4412 domain-containing protein [Verrucomicrobiae bacterium]
MRNHPFILLILLGSLAISRADLTVEQKADDGRHIRLLTTKIHGNKMRLDVRHDTNMLNIIVNLDTRDSWTLTPETKTYLQRSGADLQLVAAARRKAAGTNALEMDAPSALPVNTGKTEKIGELKAEIYTWSGAHDLKETLWVAKDFPNYKAIQTELAKVDVYNRAGAHRNGQPELSLLPGMVLRTEISTDGQKGTNTLVSATVDAVDASQFELPAGYTLWKPAKKPAEPKLELKPMAP